MPEDYGGTVAGGAAESGPNLNQPSDLTPSPSDEVGPATPTAAVKLNQKEARKLKERMKRAELYMSRKFKDNHERCLKLWRGQHWKDQRLPSYEHRVVVNYVLPNIETKVSSIAFNYPDFILRPLNQKSAQNRDVAHDALTYEWRLSNTQREAKRALFDMFLFGFGVVQHGWEFVTDEIAMEDGRQRVEGEPPDPNDLIDAVETGKDIDAAVVPKANVRKDQFYCRRLPPRDFRIDPEATWVLEDAVYCGYVEDRPVDDVKKDPRFKNVRQLKGNARNLAGFLDEDSNNLVDEQLPSDMKRVKLIHYYERKRRIHVIFCDEHDLPLFTESWQWEAERYPFECIFSARTQDVFYPEQPGPILIEPMQREINEVRSQMHIHRRRFNRKYQAKRGVLDAQTKKQLRSASDGTIIEHTGQDMEAIVPIRDLPLQEDVYHADQTAKNDLVTISAIDQYDMGMVPTKRMTTSEVQSVRGSGGARVAADAQEFEQFCGRIAKACLDWLMQFSVKTRSLPIYDDDENVMGFRDFAPEDIQGEFLVEVYVGSTQIPNTQEQIKDIGFLLQSLQPAIQAGMINPRPLFEQLLKSFPFIRNAKDIVTPPPPPQPPGPAGGPPGVPGPGGPMPVGAPPGTMTPPGADPMAQLAAAQAGGGPPLPPQLMAAMAGRNGAR